jgi:hypothetical protein
MGSLQAFANSVWTVDGPNVHDFGVLFTTRMTIVKLLDGALWVSSPVSVPFDTLTRITDLGPVKYLVAGTPRHVWRLDGWHAQFPDAELWIPRTTPLTLGKTRLPLASTLRNEPHPDWAADLDQIAFKGNPLIEEVLFFHRASRTVILDDLIQIHPIVKGRPLRNALFRLAGVAAPRGGVAVDIRLSFTKRQIARESLHRLLSWDFENLIIAHGICIEKDAKAFVKQAFRWLER